jgi:hypothetical protein
MDILYTNTSEIRSCMLLAEEDLDDTLFDVGMYERELTLHLDSWLPDHATRVTQVTPAAALTVANALKNYCAYWCALKAARTLSVSLPRQISDGKNTDQREPDFEGLLAALSSSLAQARQIIESTVNSRPSVSVKQFTAVGLGVDPVVGSGA